MKDAIIILAGGIDDDGALPAIPRRRVEKGIELLKQGLAPKLIMSGKYGFWLDQSKKIPPRAESEAMQEYAVSLGVPAEDVVAEDVSKDTVGNAYFTKINVLEPNNWKKVYVVTSKFHIPRTKIIFDLVLGSDYQIEYIAVDDDDLLPDVQKAYTQELNTIELLNKLVIGIKPGDTDGIKNFLFTKHPGYAENPEISAEQLAKDLKRI